MIHIRARAMRIAAGLFAMVAVAGCGVSKKHPDARPLAPDSLQSWLGAGKRVALLDASPDSLYERAHLSGASPVFGRRVNELSALLPVDPTIPVVIYNRTGVRPAPPEDLAYEAAVVYGFSLIYWLEGGLDAWRARGYEVDGTRLFPTPGKNEPGRGSN